jgi:signal transduction histidine kinase
LAWDGQSGAGLGLASAHEIARARGGHLAVESQPNQGTIFDVHLPILGWEKGGNLAAAENH